MSLRIGLLLPRSTDYPTMGFEILEGLQRGLGSGGPESFFFTENIGFGEDEAITYSKAEKLLLEQQVDLLIVYAGSANAESLYALANGVRKPFLILDAGMQLPQEAPSPFCYHISLQGAHACRIAGGLAGAGNRKVLMATSFYDGGYRGPFSYDRGLSEAGGSVCGNFVSGYKTADFTIDDYCSLLQRSEAAAVGACFSSYLAELFFTALGARDREARRLPFYCSPFMAEEQLLNKCDFPGGEFHAVVPWASCLQNDEQKGFLRVIRNGEHKAVTIFHLLGWEAALVVMAAWQQDMVSLEGMTYQSPRGAVVIHPETHYTFSPLYQGRITCAENGKCAFEVSEQILVDAAMHAAILSDRPGAVVTGWRNNYLCI